MNSNARAWVEALRSGNYKQDTGALRTDAGYCCLGVATDLYHKATDLGDWKKVNQCDCGSCEHTSIYAFEGENAVLHPEVMAWLGLRDAEGYYDKGEAELGESSLAEQNDSGRSFADIADLIESEPEALFG